MIRIAVPEWQLMRSVMTVLTECFSLAAKPSVVPGQM